MTSRSTAKKMARPGHKPASKSASKKPKAKLARVTNFPTASVKKPLPAAKRSSPPPASQARKSDPPPRGMPALTPPKQVQEPKQSLARSFYWSELRVGDDLPPLTKPAIDRVQIVRYAASSGDFNRLHLDEPYAHAVGFPGLFAPGMLAMAFVGQLLTAWLRRGHVRKLGARFIKIVWPGDELTCHGRIAELRRVAIPPNVPEPISAQRGTCGRASPRRNSGSTPTRRRSPAMHKRARRKRTSRGPGSIRKLPAWRIPGRRSAAKERKRSTSRRYARRSGRGCRDSLH